MLTLEDVDEFSLSNAAVLAWCAELVYQDSAAVESAMQAQGYTCKYFEPDNAELCVASNAKSIVVAFRGSVSDKDWQRDLTLGTSHELGLGEVHRGWTIAVSRGWSQLVGAIQEAGPADKSLWITGHSLGGAMAVIASARLAKEMQWKARGVYTFGQPRVGDGEFAGIYEKLLPSRFYRFANQDDIVPCVPGAPFRHFGQLCYLDKSGQLSSMRGMKQIVVDTFRSWFKNPLTLIPWFATNHAISLYLQRINKLLADQAR
ncbi:MAG TPA: lipase family protein [Rhodocyclaceae bacterium]|nr:lipase family protein [Rhodocyclaceae bacterium]